MNQAEMKEMMEEIRTGVHTVLGAAKSGLKIAEKLVPSEGIIFQAVEFGVGALDFITDKVIDFFSDRANYQLHEKSPDYEKVREAYLQYLQDIENQENLKAMRNKFEQNFMSFETEEEATAFFKANNDLDFIAYQINGDAEIIYAVNMGGSFYTGTYEEIIQPIYDRKKEVEAANTLLPVMEEIHIAQASQESMFEMYSKYITDKRDDEDEEDQENQRLRERLPKDIDNAKKGLYYFDEKNGESYKEFFEDMASTGKQFSLHTVDPNPETRLYAISLGDGEVQIGTIKEVIGSLYEKYQKAQDANDTGNAEKIEKAIRGLAGLHSSLNKAYESYAENTSTAEDSHQNSPNPLRMTPRA